MAGGLIQLLAYGSQNQYLMGNPQISFFKMVYRRHSNFSMESIKQVFDNNTILSMDNELKLSCRIDRHGDLINNMYLALTLPNIYSNDYYAFKWIENIGINIIKEISITIGGGVIDRQYGEWMHIWNELTLPYDKKRGYDKMIGNIPELYDPASVNNGIYPQADPNYNTIPSIPSKKLYIPLQFWFNRNPGLAIPLIALQYHELSINIELRSIKELYVLKSHNSSNSVEYVAPDINNPYELINNFIVDSKIINRNRISFTGLDLNAYLEVNYIFLGNDERNNFVNITQEYLIEQIFKSEIQGITGTSAFDLILQHPVKEFMWVIKRNDLELRNDWNNYTNWSANNKPIDTIDKQIMLNAKISFNGIDRFEEKDAEYFNLLQPYQHHTCNPKEGIYVYSFSINPEDFQPSGACNMSRINNIILHLQTIFNHKTEYVCTLYTMNYNVLRLMGGLGGVVFS